MIHRRDIKSYYILSGQKDWIEMRVKVLTQIKEQPEWSLPPTGLVKPGAS